MERYGDNGWEDGQSVFAVHISTVHVLNFVSLKNLLFCTDDAK